MAEAMAKEKQYTHFIAIDFGTAGCGVATSLKDSEETRAFLKWAPGKMSIKCPTIMLLDHNQECEGFGFTARTRYHKKTVKHKNEFENYYLFEYFKMNLYEEKNVSHDLMIKAVDGKALLAVVVFSKALEYIKTIVLDYINEQIQHPRRSILWIVTVPAIWSPAAKQIMRTAAEKANFTTGRDSLQLALEPEAASLYCIGNIEELLEESASGHHLVVDCGGGTVDVVAHRWLRVPPGDRYCVDETHKVHGGPCGSFAINAEFAKFLLKILKIDESEVRATCGNQWSKLIFEEFEKAKCPFEKFNLDSEATVSVSTNICNYVTKLHNKTISELIDDHKKDLERDLNLSQKLYDCAKKFNKTTSEVFASYNKLRWDDDDEDLVIPFVVMAILFIPVIDQIVKIIEDVLNADKDKSIKSICMVGGFSENKFLFSEVDGHFSSRVNVKTVPTPSQSVLFGSIKFGKNCEIIRSRIMPQTLGIETWDDFQADKHDEKRKYKDTNTGKCYCTQIFTEFIQIGQSISIENAMPSQVFTPVQSKDNTYCVSIFGSFEKEPKYINDPECYLAGEIIIKNLPPLPVNGIPCPITVIMDVRGTEIIVTAVSNAEGGQHPLNLKLDWMKDKFTPSKLP